MDIFGLDNTKIQKLFKNSCQTLMLVKISQQFRKGAVHISKTHSNYNIHINHIAHIYISPANILLNQLTFADKLTFANIE